MKNNYYILRHGQTLHQTEKKDFIYPWPENEPVALTREGRKEAEKAAEELARIGIDVIYSSDAARAKETAEIVAKRTGVKKINIDPRLRDVNLGSYNGGSKDKFCSDFPDSMERFKKVPPGGENWEDVRRRMMDFIEDVKKRHKGKKVLIVSHGDPLLILQGTIEGWSNKKILREKIEGRLIQTGEFRKINC